MSIQGLESGQMQPIALRSWNEDQHPKGDVMNKMDEKWMVDAAKYFKEEVLDIWPDVPREELSTMVGEYVYYQQREASMTDTRKVVEATCG